jgi:hypothetical protein
MGAGEPLRRFRQADAQIDIEQPPKQRKPVKLGLFRGQIWMSDDFDEPLPDEFWLGGNP